MTTWHINRAAHILRQGGIIAYPTEAVYGLGCDPFNAESVLQLLSIKKRPIDKGLILLGTSLEQFQPFLQPLTPTIQQQLQQTWPGPVTWLLPAQPSVPRYIRGQHHSLAVRISNMPIVQQLCQAFGRPIISTSANLTGHRAAKTHLQCRRIFKNQLNYTLVGKTGQLTSPTEIRDALSNQIIRAASPLKP